MDHRRVLVTGGLGFIGGVVAERFLRDGCAVTVVDSMVSNVYSPSHFKVRFPLADIHAQTIVDFLERRADTPVFDLVVHAASPVGPAALIPQAGRIAFEIVASTSRVVDYCARWNVPLAYLSSAEVYGVSGTLSETMAPRIPATHSPRIEYALGKLTSESLIANSRHRNLRALVIRPFNVVGPRQSRAAGFVMPTFVQQALGGQAVTVFGSGAQQRAFTAVEDVADFIVRWTVPAIERGLPVLNVGNPANAISIQQLARRIIHLLKSDSKVIFQDGADVYGPLYSEAQSVRKLPDISLAKSIGWQPKHSLDQIILATAEFYGCHTDARGRDARLITA